MTQPTETKTVLGECDRSRKYPAAFGNKPHAKEEECQHWIASEAEDEMERDRR